jgi:hypothetical protein
VISAVDLRTALETFGVESLNDLNSVKTCLKTSRSEFHTHETERTTSGET